MSRSTIGGVAGAAIGFIVSGYNPQGAYWGWVIGSGVGALTDNTKTYGPRLGDAAQQSSQDGTSRTYGYGTFPTTGVILWRDKRKEHEEEQGKGGPSNVSFTYTWSYAIGVCLGPINNYLIIERNGTIVYDTRTNEELTAVGYDSDQIAKTRAAQAKWMEKARLYFGDDDQMPDSTIQAVKGVNNAPAYRGFAYIVLTNEDVTSDGGAIPQYRFVVSECGSTSVDETITFPNRVLVTGAATSGEKFARALVNDPVDFEMIPLSSGATIAAQGTAAYGKNTWSVLGSSAEGGVYSVDNRVTWLPVEFVGRGGGNVGHHVYGNRQFVAALGDGAGPQVLISNWPPTVYTARNIPASWITSLGYAKGWYYYSTAQNILYRTHDFIDVEVLHESLDNAADYHYYFQYIEFDGYVYATRFQYFDTGSRRHQLVRSESGLFDDVEIIVDLPPSDFAPLYWLEAVDESTLVVYKSGGYILSSTDGFTATTSVGLAHPPVITSGPLMLKERKMTSANGRLYVMGVGGSQTEIVHSDDLVTFDTSITPQSTTTSIVASSMEMDIYAPIPDAPGSYVGPDGEILTPPGVQTNRCTPVLSAIVADQTLKREISRIVVGELNTTYVDGFRVATQTSPLANIQSLMSAYQFDGSEHDGQLWFLMRSQRALTFTITMDDLVEQGGDPFDWEITKENDLLRKVTVNYFDPLTNYAQTSQDWEMRSSTIKALGEGTFEMALTGTKEWAKQGAEKSGKIAWAERRETKLKVTLNHAARHTGEWGEFIDGRGERHVVRITQINDEGMVRELTLRKTRRSAYESLAEGVASPFPTFPAGNMRGPTVSVVMNMPVLTPDNDKAGVHWAATGMLSTWKGSKLSLARTAGTWEVAGAMDKSCTMGWLVSTLPSASRYGRDDTNTLTVQLYPFCPKTLESTTDDGILAEANAAALVYPDGTVEMIQFTTATLIAPNIYELTGLMRGRKDTTPGEHLADAMFVLLDTAIRFVELRPDDVGTTITFRAVSNGTDPDAADEDVLTMTSIESLREWQPYNVVLRADGAGGYCVEWIGRGRLGSSLMPQHSINFGGYSVTFTEGADTLTVSTVEQSTCQSQAALEAAFGIGFGTPTVYVVAKSRIDPSFDSPAGTP